MVTAASATTSTVTASNMSRPVRLLIFMRVPPKYVS
jgi:hypothetical protein